MTDLTNAIILADSLNMATGDRMTSFLLPRFPYVLIQEPATHRILEAGSTGEPLLGDINPFGETTSRNAGSTRAIPVEKMIERVKADPYIPTFTANQKGMVGKSGLSMGQIDLATDEWLEALKDAVKHVQWLSQHTGVHKDMCNRLLVPFMRIPILVSGTEWENFFTLRTAPNANPDFRAVALEMQQLYQQSKPQELKPGEWHWVFGDKMPEGITTLGRLAIATARAARLSYATHDGEMNPERDYQLHEMLVTDRHMSPFEHCAMAVNSGYDASDTRNLRGFYSYRAHIEDGVNP